MILRSALAVLFAFAVPYPHVQADARFSDPAPGAKSVSVRIHLHNTGDIAASCTVKLGGQTRITGVSASGDAFVDFDGFVLEAYDGCKHRFFSREVRVEAPADPRRWKTATF